MEGSIGGGAPSFAQAVFGSVMPVEAQVAGVFLFVLCGEAFPEAQFVALTAEAIQFLIFRKPTR